MKFLTEIGILQFNKIHVALSNYLDVGSENEPFFFVEVVEGGGCRRCNIVKWLSECVFVPAKITIL